MVEITFVDKNGNEYPDIISAWEAFKCPCQCADCNLNGVNEGLRVCSMKWITAHPYAAAYLMGYEIITTLTQNNTDNERSDNDMVKPRICNVLGVEVGEKFSITYTSHSTMITRICRIDENGNIVSDEGRLPAEALSQIINYPERIVKTTPLSDKEIEAIKAIKNLFPTAEYVEHIKNSDIVGIGNSENGWIADINNALFPSLKPGDHIDIDGACRRFGI